MEYSIIVLGTGGAPQGQDQDVSSRLYNYGTGSTERELPYCITDFRPGSGGLKILSWGEECLLDKVK